MGLAEASPALSAACWTLIAFLSGSIPFSVIVGRLAARADIRDYGDHNPGATNVLRAASWGWFVPAALLDYFKAVIPVGLAWFVVRLPGWWIVPVALAPLVGHGFSPWLRFRGGKAVAVTFGAWTGLTLGAGPMVLGMLLGLMFATVAVSGWAVVLAMLCFGGFIWRAYASAQPELLAVWAGHLAFLIWKHRADLRQPPGINPWLWRLVGRRAG